MPLFAALGKKIFRMGKLNEGQARETCHEFADRADF